MHFITIWHFALINIATEIKEASRKKQKSFSPTFSTVGIGMWMIFFLIYENFGRNARTTEKPGKLAFSLIWNPQNNAIGFWHAFYFGKQCLPNLVWTNALRSTNEPTLITFYLKFIAKIREMIFFGGNSTKLKKPIKKIPSNLRNSK